MALGSHERSPTALCTLACECDDPCNRGRELVNGLVCDRERPLKFALGKNKASEERQRESEREREAGAN